MDPAASQPRNLKSLWHTIRRWISSPIQRGYELRFVQDFWRIRNLWSRASFWYSKRIFSVRGTGRTALESTSIFFLIIRSVLSQALAAVLFVGFLGLLDRELRGTSPIVYWLSVHLRFADTLFSWLRHNSPQSALTVTTLGTLAQISGLFLGLYFTAISVVAGTNYARVPTEILDALVREKVGNLYIRIVAFFGASSLVLLLASTLGYPPGFLNLVLVTSLGTASLFSFVELGRRAFYFFDSTELVKFLAGDIVQAAKSATHLGFRWRDPAYQDHYRKQADNDLRTYEDVILLSDKESRLQGRSLQTLAIRFLLFLQTYSKEKKRIPSDSRWFERIHRHRAWLTTDEARVNMAIQTGTGLEPESIPDHSWLEKRIGNLVSKVLKGLKGQGDTGRLISVCGQVSETVGILSGEFDIENALSLFHRIESFSLSVALTAKTDDVFSSEGVDVLTESLGLADISGMAYISILLGFANRIESISVQTFAATIDDVDFLKPKTIYKTDLPRRVVEQLEYLYKGILFEHRVEGRQISPPWYCRQIAALGMLQFFVRTCESLLVELNTTYAEQAEKLALKEKYPFSAQLVQRGLEACNKFHYRTEKFKKWFESFDELRLVKDIPWPEFDSQQTHKRIEVVRDRLVAVLAKSVSGIAELPHSKEIPDYLGQTYVMLADECYASLSGGNEQRFKNLFVPFFAVSFAAQDRLRSELQDRDDKTKSIYFTEPIEDLLTISGYALVYAELEKKEFWTFAKAVWDKYLNERPNPGEVVKYLLGAIAFRRSLFAILPRDLGRTAWSQDLSHRLRQRGLSDDPFSSPFYGYKETKPFHESALIRVLARNSMLFDKSTDIFAAMYLVQREEAKGLELPESVRDLVERIKREEEERTPGTPDEE